jgi:hypothetical protein
MPTAPPVDHAGVKRAATSVYARLTNACIFKIGSTLVSIVCRLSNLVLTSVTNTLGLENRRVR